MLLKINDIEIGFTLKPLILYLKKQNINYDKHMNVLEFDVIYNDIKLNIVVFNKKGFITNVNIFSDSANEELFLKLIASDKVTFDFSKRDKMYLASYTFNEVKLQANNKPIYFAFLLFTCLVSIIFYIINANGTYSFLPLIYFLIGGILFGGIMIGIYYLIENKKSPIKELSDLEESYDKCFKGLTNYGTSNILKMSPMNIYFKDNIIIFKYLLKKKEIEFSYSFDSIEKIDTKSGFCFVFKDRTINFFLDNNDLTNELRDFLKNLRLI